MNAETRTFLVPLTDIDIPKDWNARSGDWQNDVSSPDEAEGGFDGLCASIKASNGNVTPIELRKHPHAPGSKENPSGKPYMLVAGFRRCRALEKLGILKALATIAEMTESQARVANIRENVRDSLKPADLTWAVLDLQRLGLSDEQVSRAIGLNQSYYRRLANLTQKLRPEILTEWRAAQVAVSLVDVERVGNLPEGEQPLRWKLVISGEAAKAEGTPKQQRIRRHLQHTRATRCRMLGINIALLEAVGAIAHDVNWAALALRLYPDANTDELLLVTKEIEAAYRAQKPE